METLARCDFGQGASSHVYLFRSDRLTAAVKVLLPEPDEDAIAEHQAEQAIFRHLSTRPLIPHLVRCLYQQPGITFLEYVPNSSLAQLLGDCSRGSRVLTQELRQRWMWQLCDAVAGLERDGLVHGDIRPANILFDAHWNVKLCDLGRSVNIGDDLPVATEPFGRLYDLPEGGASYGRAGPVTETFALGSVWYSLLRGREPYASDDLGKNRGACLIDKLRHQDFPDLDDSQDDRIVHDCWHGVFESVEALQLCFPKCSRTPPLLDKGQVIDVEQECKLEIESGVFGDLLPNHVSHDATSLRCAHSQEGVPQQD